VKQWTKHCSWAFKESHELFEEYFDFADILFEDPAWSFSR